MSTPPQLHQLRDNTRRKRSERSEGEEQDVPRGSPMASYTPQQRRMYLKGIRIWARVAIRSFLERRSVPPDGCRTEQDYASEPGSESEP